MRFYLLLATLPIAFLVCPAPAQTGTWDDVRNIQPGSYISVKTDRYNVKCTFHHASDTDLWCKDQFYVRRLIHEVRLENRAASAFVGALLGAGVGAGVGIALARVHDPKDPEAQVYYPLYLGIGGSILGGRMMGSASIIHGKVVYSR